VPSSPCRCPPPAGSLAALPSSHRWCACLPGCAPPARWLADLLFRSVFFSSCSSSSFPLSLSSLHHLYIFCNFSQVAWQRDKNVPTECETRRLPSLTAGTLALPWAPPVFPPAQWSLTGALTGESISLSLACPLCPLRPPTCLLRRPRLGCPTPSTSRARKLTAPRAPFTQKFFLCFRLDALLLRLAPGYDCQRTPGDVLRITGSSLCFDSRRDSRRSGP